MLGDQAPHELGPFLFTTVAKRRACAQVEASSEQKARPKRFPHTGTGRHWLTRVRPYHSLGGLLLTSMVCAKVLPSLADDCIRPSERPCSPITLKRKQQKL